MKNTNIAIGERYFKFFTELFILKLFRRPFPVWHAQENGSDCDHVQATNLRFNWIIIMELYNVRNMPGKALKRGTAFT
jgi:hypothetical protein